MCILEQQTLCFFSLGATGTLMRPSTVAVDLRDSDEKAAD